MTATLWDIMEKQKMPLEKPPPVEGQQRPARPGLRDFQSRALDAVHESFRDHQSTLITMPTGCGKTHVFTHLVEERKHLGRAMIVAHRKELVQQAYDKIYHVTGHYAEIEMANSWADRHDRWRARAVIASVPTLARERYKRFDPFEFGLLVIDEAHHAPAVTYRRVIDHFRKNPNLRVLGVTATPDRADKKAMGMVFQDSCYDYTILEAIEDGWLVMPRQRFVTVAGLDFSGIRKTAGDLNGGQLEEVLRYEKNLHGIAYPTLQMTGHMKRVLVFAASVAHAHRLAEIFNRHEPDCARCVSAGTPDAERESIFGDFKEARYRYLVNVGITTEGWDSPGVEAVVMARPTLSRSLYAQMLGRGTRPFPVRIVDQEPTPEARQAAIARSSKPVLEVLDFVGNSGKHSLVCTLDILGGNYDEGTIQAARERAQEAPGAKDGVDPVKTLADQRSLEEASEARKRKRVVMRAKYSTVESDPFKRYNLLKATLDPYQKSWPLTDKQKLCLQKLNLSTDGLSRADGTQILRAAWYQPTPKQIRCLQRAGYSEHDLKGIDKHKCSKLISNLVNWRRPDADTRRLDQSQPIEIVPNM